MRRWGALRRQGAVNLYALPRGDVRSLGIRAPAARERARRARGQKDGGRRGQGHFRAIQVGPETGDRTEGMRSSVKRERQASGADWGTGRACGGEAWQRQARGSGIRGKLGTGSVRREARERQATTSATSGQDWKTVAHRQRASGRKKNSNPAGFGFVRYFPRPGAFAPSRATSDARRLSSQPGILPYLRAPTPPRSAPLPTPPPHAPLIGHPVRFLRHHARIYAAPVS
jgi:hypothetical protein